MSAIFTQPEINLREIANKVECLDITPHTENVLNVADYISTLDGSSDVSGELQKLFDVAVSDSKSNIVFVPENVTLRIDSDVNMPNFTSLVGEVRMGQPDAGSRIQSHGGSLVVNNGNTIAGLVIRRDGATTAEGTGVGVAGTLVNYLDTAIKGNPSDQNTDIILRDLAIFGFDTGIDVTNINTNPATTSPYTRGRWVVENINIDCKLGFNMNNVKDTCYFSNVHGWPFLGNGITTLPDNLPSGTKSGAPRSILFQMGMGGTEADLGADWLRFSGCFAHTHERLLLANNCNKLSMANCGYDFEWFQSAPENSYGVLLQGFASNITIVGSQFSGGEHSILANLDVTGGLNRAVTLSGCSFANAKIQHVQMSANAAVSGCTFTNSAVEDIPNPDWAYVGVGDAAPDQTSHSITGCQFINITGGIANGGNATPMYSVANGFTDVTTNEAAGVQIVSYNPAP